LSEQGEALDYLCVEAFVETIVGARTLETALELGLIDTIHRNPGRSRDEFKHELRADAQGLDFLFDLLSAHEVIDEEEGRIELTKRFEKALAYRDLLEAKLAFAKYTLHDFSRLFTLLVAAPGRFAREAKIFEFFGYNRCSEETREAYELTKRWMSITTVYTKYESLECMKYYDFSPYSRILDVGGNSGEFMLQLCRQYPGIQGTVFDLPLVCELGMEHVRLEPEAARIEFFKGNALKEEFRGGVDLVCFKSMLHDWPEKEAKGLLAKACRALKPGGTLLIFERGPIDVGERPKAYSMIPMFLFFRSFRPPSVYSDHMRALGFQDIRIQAVDLEMRFFLVTGTLSSPSSSWV